MGKLCLQGFNLFQNLAFALLLFLALDFGFEGTHRFELLVASRLVCLVEPGYFFVNRIIDGKDVGLGRSFAEGSKKDIGSFLVTVKFAHKIHAFCNGCTQLLL